MHHIIAATAAESKKCSVGCTHPDRLVVAVAAVTALCRSTTIDRGMRIISTDATRSRQRLAPALATSQMQSLRCGTFEGSVLSL